MIICNGFFAASAEAIERKIGVDDSAYKRCSHITSYFAEYDELFARFNRRMKRVRISIECSNYTT